MSSRVYPLYDCQNIQKEKITNTVLKADLVINVDNNNNFSYIKNYNIFNYKINKIDDKNNDKNYSIV